MTQDEIIRMALDGIQSYLSNGGLFNPKEMNHDKVRELIMLCRDALDLVAAHERRKCEQEMSLMEEHCAELILIEREACAKVCEEVLGENNVSAAIRARSEK